MVQGQSKFKVCKLSALPLQASNAHSRLVGITLKPSSKVEVKSHACFVKVDMLALIESL